MTLTEIINSIALNVGISLLKKPKTHEQLLREPFMENVSPFGLEMAIRKLYREKKINNLSFDRMEIKPEFTDEFQGELFKVF